MSVHIWLYLELFELLTRFQRDCVVKPVTEGFWSTLDFHSRNCSYICSPAGLVPIAAASVELPPLQVHVFAME